MKIMSLAEATAQAESMAAHFVDQTRRFDPHSPSHSVMANAGARWAQAAATYRLVQILEVAEANRRGEGASRG